MSIDYIKIVGCKRISYNGHQSIECTFTEAIQFILGSNGSGKSTLVGELSLLPPDMKHYSKNGGKEVKQTIRGHQYHVTSFGNKHTFRIDGGENLNTGGTQTVQRELIKRYTGYTQDIHDLLLASTHNDRFSTMPIPKRREWFTKMSVVSYDYAIGLYNRARKSERNLQGSVELLKKRLVVEQSKTTDAEELSRLQREIKEHDDALAFLYSQRSNEVHESSHQLLGHWEQSLHQAKQLITSELRALKSLKPPSRSTLDALQQHQFVLQGSLTQLQRRYQQSFNQHREVEKLIQAYESQSAKAIAMLDQQIASFNETISRVQSLFVPDDGWDGSLPHDTHDFSVRVQGIIELLLDLAEDHDRVYTTEALEQVTHQLETLNHRLEKLNELQIIRVAEIEHMAKHADQGQVECPKCTHQWVPNYDAVKHQELKDRLVKIRAALHEHQSQQSALLAKRSDIMLVLRQREQVFYAIRNATQYAGLLSDIPAMLFTPSKAVAVLKTRMRNIELQQSIVQDIRQRDELLATRQSAQIQDVSTGERLYEQRKFIEDDIQLLTSEINDYKQQLVEVAQDIKLMERVTQLETTLDQLLVTRDEISSKIQQSTYQEWLSEYIRTVQHGLTQRRQAYEQMTARRTVIEDIESQIAQQTIQWRAATQLVRDLSPSEGLIAQGMMGFINAFVKNMNKFIAQIWSYPLVISGCQLQDEQLDLDYYFPLSAHGNPPVDDVSKGSTAQKHVVDVAYVLTAMRFLKLDSSILYLDEFGASFDTHHRSTAILALKKLIETSNYSQVFMISHYVETMDAFPTSEILCLCPLNVTVPSTANRHAEFT